MKKVWDFTAPVIIICATLYLIIITTIDQAGESLGNMPSWASRVALLAASTAAIVRYRLQNNNLITFKEGLAAGMFAALSVGAVISLHTFVFRTYIRPSYNEELKAIVAQNLALQVDEEGKKVWTEAQIQRQLSQQWGYYFTTQGGVIIDILGAIGLGLLASTSVAYMARRVRIKD